MGRRSHRCWPATGGLIARVREEKSQLISRGTTTKPVTLATYSHFASKRIPSDQPHSPLMAAEGRPSRYGSDGRPGWFSQLTGCEPPSEGNLAREDKLYGWISYFLGFVALNKRVTTPRRCSKLGSRRQLVVQSLVVDIHRGDASRACRNNIASRSRGSWAGGGRLLAPSKRKQYHGLGIEYLEVNAKTLSWEKLWTRSRECTP